MPASLSLLDAIYQRRATRSYTTARVDDATIRELLRAAVHAPTAMHAEPWAFVIVQDPALLKQISDRAKTQTIGMHPSLARTATGTHAPAALTDPSFNIFYDATTLIVICAETEGAFAAADCWLAAENLMLAATALGLATCPIGFALSALTVPEVKAKLAIPESVTPFAAMIVGVAAVTPPPTTRRDPEILSWTKP